MGAKVEVKTIPLHGLFIYRKQVWRSLGKLRAESHSTSCATNIQGDIEYCTNGIKSIGIENGKFVLFESIF